MNKYLRNAVPRIVLVGWAIALESATACSSFHNTFEGHYAGMVGLSTTCFQSVDSNNSSLVIFFLGDLSDRF